MSAARVRVVIAMLSLASLTQLEVAQGAHELLDQAVIPLLAHATGVENPLTVPTQSFTVGRDGRISCIDLALGGTSATMDLNIRLFGSEAGEPVWHKQLASFIIDGASLPMSSGWETPRLHLDFLPYGIDVEAGTVLAISVQPTETYSGVSSPFWWYDSSSSQYERGAAYFGDPSYQDFHRPMGREWDFGFAVYFAVPEPSGITPLLPFATIFASRRLRRSQG